ncbi:hypothetical protein KCU95_g14892, partial [Aureobasidium melanogenum]
MAELRRRKRHEPNSGLDASDTSRGPSSPNHNEPNWKRIEERLARLESDVAKLPTQAYFDHQFGKFPSMKLEMAGYIERAIARGFNDVEDKLDRTLE